MSKMDQWVVRTLRRLHFGQFLQTAAEWLAAFLLVFGGAVLVVKLLTPRAWPHVLWVAAASVPVAFAAWLSSRRHRFSRSESVALLDRRLQTGGLLLTLSEQPEEVWLERLPQVEAAWRESLPKVRPVRFAKALVAPLAFAIAACFVPLRKLPAEPIQTNLVGRTASQQLEETLAALEEAQVLEPEEQRKLKQEIEKLAEEAREQPLTHEKWETVDALRERLKLRFDTADLLATKGRDAVNALKQAMKDGDIKVSQDEQNSLEEEAIETLRKIQKRGPMEGKNARKTGSGGKGLERLMKNGRFSSDPREREEELEDLEDFLKEESEKLGKCRGKCQGNNGEDGDGDGETDEPGNGGVSRGRGDAKLTYGDESTEDGTKFKEVALPPGFLDQPGQDVTQVSPAAPDETPAASAPRSGKRQIDAASGNETVNRNLRPRHKSVVKQYFDGK